MITEINTVFQLRRDTLDKWNTSSYILQPGEVALAYTSVETVVNGELTSVPVVLLKAGELTEGSTKTFNDLPYMSALAADVAGWAKQSGLNIIDRGTGSFISDVYWEEDYLVIQRSNSNVDVDISAVLNNISGDLHINTTGKLFYNGSEVATVDKILANVVWINY